jgi:hypothetical protein
MARQILHLDHDADHNRNREIAMLISHIGSPPSLCGWSYRRQGQHAVLEGTGDGCWEAELNWFNGELLLRIGEREPETEKCAVRTYACVCSRRPLDGARTTFGAWIVLMGLKLSKGDGISLCGIQIVRISARPRQGIRSQPLPMHEQLCDSSKKCCDAQPSGAQRSEISL